LYYIHIRDLGVMRLTRCVWRADEVLGACFELSCIAGDDGYADVFLAAQTRYVLLLLKWCYLIASPQFCT
jgi:hypothetical protein